MVCVAFENSKGRHVVSDGSDLGSVEAANEQNWQVVDRTLQGIAMQRAKLDADEARWLRAAERLRIWREVGCVSMLEYMELRLGYAPHNANERLRTARALGELPGLEAKLERGELPLSGARALTRVMTPDTEARWLAETDGKNVREIEAMVSGRAKGDLPDDPQKPELMIRRLSYEVAASTFVRERQARQVLEELVGERVDDNAFLAALLDVFLEGGRPGDEQTERHGRAKYQVAVTLCRQCGIGRQRGGGLEAPMNDTEVARAECDAQRISLDGPGRAAQDIPPATRRFVFHRDGDRCIVPGCRSTRCIEIHHIKAREHGGTHDAWNLVLLCDAHHAMLHEGKLSITGRAPDELVITKARSISFGPAVGSSLPTHAQSHVRPKQAQADTPARRSKLEEITNVVHAKSALVTAGFKKREAAIAVDSALSSLGPAALLDELIRVALARVGKS